MRDDPLLLRKKLVTRLIAKVQARTGDGPTPGYINEAVYRYERRFPGALGEALKTDSIAKTQKVTRGLTSKKALLPVDLDQPELPFFAGMPLRYMRYSTKVEGRKEDHIIGNSDDRKSKGRHFEGQKEIWTRNFDKTRRSYEKRMSSSDEVEQRLKDKGAESGVDWQDVAMWDVRDASPPPDIDDDFDDDLDSE